MTGAAKWVVVTRPPKQSDDHLAILAALERHEVEYVLIGGVAASVHGSPYPTYDVDITPKSTTSNLARLAAAINQIGAKIIVDDDDSHGVAVDFDAVTLSREVTWNLVTRFGVLDLEFAPSGTAGYTDLARSATRLELGENLTVLVASLGDVIRSKAEANRAKDRRVLPELRALSEMRRKRGL